MKFLTDEKLVIVGAGGMIGSNMVQSVLMLHGASAERACFVGLLSTEHRIFLHGVFGVSLREKVCKNRQKRPFLLSGVYKVSFCY